MPGAATRGQVRYSSGYRWQLRQSVVYQTGIKGYTVNHEWFVLTCHGELWLRDGYATDGITGVTGWVWEPLLSRGWLRYASFGHDALCQAIRINLLPKSLSSTAHDLLRQWCLEAGAKKWQTDLVFLAVLRFNEISTGGGDRPILVAP